MTYTLSKRSLNSLNGVHPDLVRVIKRAIQITDIDFVVIEGMRTVERQKKLVAEGASKTMNSRHIIASNGYGHAVDVVPYVGGKISWDWPLYNKLAKSIKQAAKECGVPLEWGGDWKTFKDGPHWQLPWKQYPAQAAVDGKKYTAQTETQSRNQSVAIMSGGGITASPIAGEPIANVIEAATGQQTELTSGDITRIIIAVVIMSLSIYLAFYRSRE